MKTIQQYLNKFWGSEVVRYLLIGIATTVVSMITYSLALGLNIHYAVANVISWVLAVSFAYFANKLWVFRTRGITGLALVKEIGFFFSARLLSLLLEEVGLALLIESPAMLSLVEKGLNLTGLIARFEAQSTLELLAKLVMQFVVIVANYIFSKLVIFKKKDDGHGEASEKEDAR